jgi:UDP-GlcNAc:undecaprenyl-phosphate GlcNAc-1-phosphate transferase
VYISLTGRLVLGIGIAGTLSYAATPLAIRTARRFAFYDRPLGYKGHGRPTPYLGGTAVILAFAVAMIAVAGDPRSSLLLTGAVGVLLVVGTVDDKRTVPPLVRVICEFGLGVLLAALDLGWSLGSGALLDTVVTGIWVVGVVNAFNLFDNMDGASSTMALAASAGICALGIVTGNAWVVAGSAALCGACLGFLPHNLSSPAKIFLGDGGSMPIGFAVAVLAANAARSAEPGALSLLVGCLLVGVPALDTALVIVSRTRRGISVLTGGRDHLTHRTRMRMKTPGRVALVLGGAQAAVSAVVILASQAGSPALVYIVLAFVVLAVTAIVALEEAIPMEPAGAQPVVAAEAPERQTRWPWRRHFPTVVLAVVGLGAGLSPLFSAYYSPDVWTSIGVALMVLAAMGTVARPPRIHLPVALVVIGLTGLGLWSLLSIVWAQAVEQATLGANLWLSYAALVLLIVIVMRGRRDAAVLLGFVGLGIAVVAISVLIRLLGSDPGALLIVGRLNSPLGYINGEGCVFAMGVWLGLALAERREPGLAALGVLASVVMAGLVVLSQSRGAAIATAAALLVTLAAIPGRRRRIMAMALIVAAFAAAAGPLDHVYSVGQLGTIPAAVAHHAVGAIVLAGAMAGLVWGCLVALVNMARRRGSREAVLAERAATVLALIAIVAPIAAGIVRAPQLEQTARQQWRAFVHLGAAEGGASGSQTRLFSGAGNRYDYWRVAWHVFKANPVIGVGAGNYTPHYFRDRRTQESIANPHSLELQTLSELGVAGLVLLLVAAGGVTLGVVRLAPRARASRGTRGLLVAGTGVVVVWLVDSSGDWMHLLPGVTAIALCAMAALTGSAGPDLETRSRGQGRDGPHRLPALLGSAAIIFVLAIGGASLLRDGLARHYVNEAQASLHSDPAAAIDASNRSLGLDPANLDAYYVKAAGQARFNRAATARATLMQAVQQDPGDFITWTLLGDLEVRAGDVGAARGYYRRALHLDPREPALRMLVSEPAKRLLQSAH